MDALNKKQRVGKAGAGKRRKVRARLLDDAAVDALEPRATRYDVPAGGGLSLRVGKSGTKTWSMIYEVRGRPVRATLGRFPEVNCERAYNQTRSIKSDARRGYDPAERAGEVHTFADLSAKYLELYARPNKKSWREDERMLDRTLLPHWGQLKLFDIRRRDVVEFHQRLAASGRPILANRCFALFRKICNWATELEYFDANPASNIRRPARENRRDRVLSPDEIRLLWTRLPMTRTDDRITLAIRLALLTAQRAGEISGARWDEIDLDSGWWTLPGTRAKNKLSHRIWLSQPARQILRHARLSSGGSEFVFPSVRGEGPLRPPSLSQAMRVNREALGIAPFVVHDLRRTAASGMTGAGVARVVVGKILNHAETGVTSVYDRSSYDQEKRDALDLWARRLAEIVGDDELLGFASRKVANE